MYEYSIVSILQMYWIQKNTVQDVLNELCSVENFNIITYFQVSKLYKFFGLEITIKERNQMRAIVFLYKKTMIKIFSN
jgi:hypothetical protein